MSHTELAAYDRACRALMMAKLGPKKAIQKAPVMQLSEATVVSLFTPSAYENLVTKFLKVEEPECSKYNHKFPQ